MRYSLLELTQLILSAMDSDEVNSISDTVESNQVALLLKSVYYDIATELRLPELDGLYELNASGDNNLPTYMTVPSNAVRLDRVFYNNKLTADTYSSYVECEYMPFDTFLQHTSPLKNLGADVGEMSFTHNDETFEMMYRSDRMPKYFTSVDDRIVIFDSYDSEEDTTLQKSKTQCYGSIYPVFTLQDAFEPELDPDQFSYYINRAKVRAFSELKQTQNIEAAAETRLQKISGQRSRRRVPDRTEHNQLPNYGKK